MAGACDRAKSHTSQLECLPHGCKARERLGSHSRFKGMPSVTLKPSSGAQETAQWLMHLLSIDDDLSLGL